MHPSISPFYIKVLYKAYNISHCTSTRLPQRFALLDDGRAVRIDSFNDHVRTTIEMNTGKKVIDVIVSAIPTFRYLHPDKRYHWASTLELIPRDEVEKSYRNAVTLLKTELHAKVSDIEMCLQSVASKFGIPITNVVNFVLTKVIARAR